MSKHYPFLFFALFFTLPFPSMAQSLHPDLHQAYRQILNLQLEEALPLIEKKYEDEPDQAFRLYIQSLSDFMDLMLFKEPEKYEFYKKKRNYYQDNIQSLDKERAWVAFVEGELKLHDGLISVNYGDYLYGSLKLIQAHNLTRQNISLFEEDAFFNKTYGVINIVLSLIPERHNWILTLLQIKPDMQQGKRQLQYIAGHKGLFQQEGQLLLALLHAFYIKDFRYASDILEKAQFDLHNSLLINYLYGIISTKTYKNESAIRYFESCSRLNRGYKELPVVEYHLGETYLRRLELDRSLGHYNKFLKISGPGSDFIKDSYYKLSLIFLLKKSSDSLNYYRKKGLNSGSLSTEKDRYAQYMISENEIPHPDLLKARFLFDGGYFEKALNILYAISLTDLRAEEKFELHYRLGRLYQMSGNSPLAIQNFNKAMLMKEFSEHYLMANAHLQMGYIYSGLEYPTLAESQFRQAIKYTGELYGQSIRNEARTAIEFLEIND